MQKHYANYDAFVIKNQKEEEKERKTRRKSKQNNRKTSIKISSTLDLDINRFLMNFS